MNIIYETDKLRLEHEFESARLVDKENGRILFEDDFYGDPKCGLIDANNKWAIIAGEHLTIWTTKTWKRMDMEELKWIHSLRVKNLEKVEILTDPWREKSAIWEIDTITFEVKKIKDFMAYKDQDYTENISW